MNRTRRLRKNENMRSLVRENSICVDQLIYPIFVVEENNVKNPIDSMPGIYQFSLDKVLDEVKKAVELGVKSFLLFGIPNHKDEVGSGAYEENGVVPRAIKLIKNSYPDVIIIADVCLCEYTSHGHCGLVRDGEILNDETLPLLAKSSVCYAKAGADIIAPSDMMDLRVAAIREALDEEGFTCFTFTGLFLGQSIRLPQITLFLLLHVLPSHAHICDAYKYDSMHVYGVCGLLLLSVRV